MPAHPRNLYFGFAIYDTDSVQAVAPAFMRLNQQRYHKYAVQPCGLPGLSLCFFVNQWVKNGFELLTC